LAGWERERGKEKLIYIEIERRDIRKQSFSNFMQVFVSFLDVF
jgi:hypothetical protein